MLVHKLYAALFSANSHNLGDYIQTLAAMQHLPRIDYWLDRDTGTLFDKKFNAAHPVPIVVLYNGWFNHRYAKFPPPSFVDPIFVSFHIDDVDRTTDPAYSILNCTTCPPIITHHEYLQKYSPIGARSMHTYNLLKTNGIDCFSGDITITLKKPQVAPHNRILAVDVRNDAPDLYDKFIPEHIRANAKHTTQILTKTVPHGTKLRMAKKLIKKIAAAPMIITSRLHTLLVALAFSKPAIFINDHLEDITFGGLLKCPVYGYNNKVLVTPTVSIDFNDFTWNHMVEIYGADHLSKTFMDKIIL